MKKLAALLLTTGALILGGLAVTAAPAAGKSCTQDPTQEKCLTAPTTTTVVVPTTTISESPGANCSHGVNDDGSCRPDPNENGQDCDEHGAPNPAGNDGNEDHCLPSETTTATETTTTEVPTTTVTDETETTTTVTTEVPATTTTQVPTVPPIVTTTTVPSETETSTQPTSPDTESDGPSGTKNGGSETPKKLAFTGVEDIVPIAVVALLLLTFGMFFLRLSRNRDAE